MPWEATTHERADEAGEVFMMNYMRLIGVAILYWDHIVTFDKEVTLIWRRRKSLSSYCFFVNRYFAFFTLIPSASVPFVTLSRTACAEFCTFRELVLLMTQTIVAAIMIIRLYALFRRDKRILYGLVVFVGVLVSLVIWSIQGQHGWYPKVIGGCHWTMSAHTALHLAGPWEGLFAFDTVVFLMTVYSAYSTRKRTGPTVSLQTLFVRDGAMYFGIVALVNLLNILTYYLDNHLLCPGSLATIAIYVSVTAISRLLLNLHSYAADAGILTNHEPELTRQPLHEDPAPYKADHPGGFGGRILELGLHTMTPTSRTSTGPIVLSI
ncbi:hypothetical protein MIND_01351300 [Mycena indigotica]|uniref:DUF6533 domain-containing protein n=1 Tax=Mycena indigotica TaxID=2126181 RepID=A0A8H6RYQ3_9AGAR|nr:uncharacterized protein MIND_01351300 [Mycena indigotica]KAF7289774.1 hypothetical protein MIND_01351300 [Mycena indigotica]